VGEAGEDLTHLTVTRGSQEPFTYTFMFRFDRLTDEEVPTVFPLITPLPLLLISLSGQFKHIKYFVIS
jgi:hypothetical protein